MLPIQPIMDIFLSIFFFANNHILKIYKYFRIKSGVHKKWGSYAIMGGHFIWVPFFEGGWGGEPPKIFNFFLPKVAQQPYPKSQTIREHVPPVRNRVTVVSRVSQWEIIWDKNMSEREAAMKEAKNFQINWGWAGPSEDQLKPVSHWLLGSLC